MNYKIVNGSVSYGAETILEEINFEIKEKDKIAIVGRNGCGKSTLLNAIIDNSMFEEGIEEEKFNGFTKKKMWTYLWIFLFTPYGIYRLFDENNEFLYQQKVIWLIVGIVYIICMINQFIHIF